MMAPLKIGSLTSRIFRKNFVWLLALSLTSFCSVAAIIIANADFKGNWTYNEQKSKLAEGRFRMNASKLKVTGEGDALVIERTSTSQNGDDIVATEKLTFDGKTSESTAFGTSKKKSSATWSADGQQMTINSTIVFERDGNSTEIKIVEIWKLVDAKTLSIEYTASSPRGTTTNTFAYDKN